MKTIMTFLSIVFTLFTSTAALAHTDHNLGDGALHHVYHIVFWFVIFAAIYKGVTWYKSKNK